MFGGKGDQLVVEAVGVVPGLAAQAGDVSRSTAEPAGLADAVALGDVVEDRVDLLRREPGAEERSPLALGESGLAGAAAEHPPGLLGAVATGEVRFPAPRLPCSGQSELRQQKRERSSMVGAPPMRSWVLGYTCADLK